MTHSFEQKLTGLTEQESGTQMAQSGKSFVQHLLT